MNKLEVGSVVKFLHGEDLLDITLGVDYPVYGSCFGDFGDSYFLDDAGEKNFAANNSANTMKISTRNSGEVK
jgi:hypothetical protein